MNNLTTVIIAKIRLPDGSMSESKVEGQSLTIGRSSRCQISLKEESLSRTHCRVDLINGNLHISDLNSSNGTYINEEKIPPGVIISLAGTKSVAIGNLQCQFSFKQVETAPLPMHKDLVLELESPRNQSIQTGHKIKITRRGRRPSEVRPEGKKSNNIILMALIFGLVIYFAFFHK